MYDGRWVLAEKGQYICLLPFLPRNTFGWSGQIQLAKFEKYCMRRTGEWVGGWVLAEKG